MQRGPFRYRDPGTGTYPWESFQIESSEVVSLVLTDEVTGDPLDVSSSSLRVYLRAKVKGTASLPVNLLMTKDTPSSGRVSAWFRPSSTSFAAGDQCVMGAFIVNTATVDTPTPSGFVERLWRGLWEWKCVGAIDSVSV